MIHHIERETSGITACGRRRFFNTVDPMPATDSFTLGWREVTCPTCLGTSDNPMHWSRAIGLITGGAHD